MIQRITELRHLEVSKVHEISLILDENEGWRQVMGMIPKKIDARSCSFDNTDWHKLTDEVGYKYTNDEIRKIAQPRQGDSRLPAEIFIDEWATSGRKENRPTVGVLLQLLIQAQLFRAADLVSEWIGEPPPTRPSTGPAARVNTSLPSEFFNDVESFANDSSFQPATEDLFANAMMTNGRLDNNKDFYMKYRCDEKNWSGLDNIPPKPAPRRNRKSERIQSQEQEDSNHLTQQSTTTESRANAAASTAAMNGIHSEQEKTSPTTNGRTTESTDIQATQQLPLLSVFFSNTIPTETTSIENYSVSSLPLLSALQEEPTKSDDTLTDVNNLPLISALNLNGAEHHNDREEEGHSENQIQEIEEIQQNGFSANELDDDDSNDDSKIGSSNNDSSLTNVTGTSGENSFELSSRSTSNENIPVNVLQY